MQIPSAKETYSRRFDFSNIPDRYHKYRYTISFMLNRLPREESTQARIDLAGLLDLQKSMLEKYMYVEQDFHRFFLDATKRNLIIRFFGIQDQQLDTSNCIKQVVEEAPGNGPGTF